MTSTPESFFPRGNLMPEAVSAERRFWAAELFTFRSFFPSAALLCLPGPPPELRPLDPGSTVLDGLLTLSFDPNNKTWFEALPSFYPFF